MIDWHVVMQLQPCITAEEVSNMVVALGLKRSHSTNLDIMWLQQCNADRPHILLLSQLQFKVIWKATAAQHQTGGTVQSLQMLHGAR